MSLSELFGDDEKPKAIEVVEEKILSGGWKDNEVVVFGSLSPEGKTMINPTPPDPVVERSAARLNTILRRFIVNGYQMDIMAGKYRVKRGDKVLTKWHNSFLDAITEITPEIVKGLDLKDLGESPYETIGRLQSLLQDAYDWGSDSPLGDSVRERIEKELKK